MVAFTPPVIAGIVVGTLAVVGLIGLAIYKLWPEMDYKKIEPLPTTPGCPTQIETDWNPLLFSNIVAAKQQSSTDKPIIYGVDRLVDDGSRCKTPCRWDNINTHIGESGWCYTDDAKVPPEYPSTRKWGYCTHECPAPAGMCMTTATRNLSPEVKDYIDKYFMMNAAEQAVEDQKTTGSIDNIANYANTVGEWQMECYDDILRKGNTQAMEPKTGWCYIEGSPSDPTSNVKRDRKWMYIDPTYLKNCRPIPPPGPPSP